MAALLQVVADAEGRDLPLIDFRTGVDSGMEKPWTTVARSVPEWAAVWRAHQGGQPDAPLPEPPALDFRRVMVLAVFSGTAQGRRAYRVVSAQEGPDRATVRLAVQTENPAPGVDVNETAYAFFVIGRSDKKIRIEVPGTDPKTGEPGWVRLTELPAAK
jgi:hypothetical protein